MPTCRDGDRFPFSPDCRYTPPDPGVDDLRRLHDRLGLEQAVLVQASCHGTDNAALLDALLQGKGRYAGVAMIDDGTGDAEVDELHAAGVPPGASTSSATKPVPPT